MLGTGALGASAVFLFLLLGNLVHHLDEHEDTEGNDEEVETGLEEVTVVDGSRLQFLTSYIDGREGEFEVGEIHAANQPSYRRHDDVIYNRAYDFAKGTTDDNTDGHVEHIATHGEFLEFIQKFTHTFIFLIKTIV